MRVGCGGGAGACAAGRPGRAAVEAAVEAVGGAGRAPHCLLCVLSSGGGGGEQGAVPAPVAPALWPPPLRCPGRFGQGQRAAFLTFVRGWGGGRTGPGPRAERAWAVRGDPALGALVGWGAKGSGQVLEDVGGSGWRVWADWGEKDGWRDLAHWGVRPFGQVRETHGGRSECGQPVGLWGAVKEA